MLLPSPEFQNRLDRERFAEAIEEKTKVFETFKRSKMTNRILRTVAGLALISTGVSLYANDVYTNQALEANSRVTISALGNPLEKTNNNSALIFLDGFGSINADMLTKYMSRAIQPIVDGHLWSIDYNDAPLSYNNIADRIIEAANAQHIDTISLIGYSAGGSLTAQVMEAVSKKSSLRINSVFLISTPDGIHGLRPAPKNQIDTIESLKWIPGVEHSSFLRFVGEMAFRSGAYTSGDNFFSNVGDFFTTANNVFSSIQNHDLPSTRLMFDQVLAIENANIKDRVSNLNKLPATTVRPTIIYVGTAKPGYDYLVNNSLSSKNIGNYAEAAKVPYFDINVPGAVHTRPDLDNAQYVKTLGSAKEEIQASISFQTSTAYGNLLTERFKNLASEYPPLQDESIAAPADQLQPLP